MHTDLNHFTRKLKKVSIRSYTLKQIAQYFAHELSAGIYSLDGEVIEYGPVQASIIPSGMQVISLVDDKLRGDKGYQRCSNNYGLRRVQSSHI